MIVNGKFMLIINGVLAIIGLSHAHMRLAFAHIFVLQYKNKVLNTNSHQPMLRVALAAIIFGILFGSDQTAPTVRRSITAIAGFVMMTIGVVAAACRDLTVTISFLVTIITIPAAIDTKATTIAVLTMVTGTT